MRTISTADLRSMRDGGQRFNLINVLPNEHFEERHIPGSKNIPFEGAGFEGAFVDAVNQEVDAKNDQVVVYCASPTCDLSPKAARQLEQAGFTNVMDYEGGVKAWADAGLPIEGTKSAAT